MRTKPYMRPPRSHFRSVCELLFSPWTSNFFTVFLYFPGGRTSDFVKKKKKKKGQKLLESEEEGVRRSDLLSLGARAT